MHEALSCKELWTSRRVLALCAVFVVCTSCAAPQQRDLLYQVSVIDALLAGDYQGVVTIGELLRHGDFGLGTFDGLDGEMIVLDGIVYQARVDGSVAVAHDGETTPWAVVARFAPKRTLALKGRMSLHELEHNLDEAIDNTNLFYALRIDVTLRELTLRSVPEQTRPHRKLADVIKDQAIWTHQEVSGTLVGFRSPAYTKGVSVPGYHWHFISEDRRSGGHVLSAELDGAQVQVDPLTEWQVQLPKTGDFGRLDFALDRSEDKGTRTPRKTPIISAH